VSAGFPTGGYHFDCTTAIQQLYVYLDGELTEERRIQISEHLDYCGPCAGAAVFEAELRVVIANRCKDHVPESLRDRIAALIEAERHQPAPGDPGRDRS
jgi:mycothiol system anti-sigma-R factor